MVKKFFSSKKRVAILVVVLLIIIGIVVGVVIGWNRLKMNAGVVVDTVEAIPLETRDLSDAININGKVESQNVLAITTDLQGAKIEDLKVSLGDRVEVGDELLTFDATSIKEQIDNINTQNSQAKQLEQLQKNIAQRDYNNAVNNRNEMVAIAQNSLNEAQTEFDQINATSQSLEEKEFARKRLEEAKAALSSAIRDGDASVQSAKDALDSANINASGGTDSNKELMELNSQLGKTTVKTTQSGVITKLDVDKGSIASGTLMQIEDDKNLRIVVPVKENDIMKLEVGMKAKITSNAFEGEEFQGTVSQVINFASADIATGGDEMGGGSSSGSYSAIVDVDPGSPLLLGMTVQVSITLNEAESSLAVPYDSIMEDENGNQCVFRAIYKDEENYTIEKVLVETGMSNNYYTQINSADLMEGDLIITMPWYVEDGQVTPVYVIYADSTMDMMVEEY